MFAIHSIQMKPMVICVPSIHALVGSSLVYVHIVTNDLVGRVVFGLSCIGIVYILLCRQHQCINLPL